ncbi:hypothetical protein B7C51_24740 (plasmid) [Paenibacillus larvae subsp. pulvifaciens]|uniref:Uncharacterized protein n=1 Tax=Paenibacillus larvae subsp. pulvifaciens TaxID=1477 RepID=A0A1V0UZQ9_9BACL|nr:hypothetical protein [Paenibacillus larvae]ARF70684.1 hypothetical protein B7C51_24740 [Paenibacillus larvae subsp. pulvifaciens]
MAISKNLKAVLEHLGNQYTVKTIDLEECAYRKLNDRYDIEISGCRKKNGPYHVYVWDITRGTSVAAQIVEQFSDIKGLPQLKATLKHIETKYGTN